jgi:hypothetical protein
LKTVGDKEKLFGDKGERLQMATTIVVIVAAVVEEFEDRFPTIIR